MAYRHAATLLWMISFWLSQTASATAIPIKNGTPITALELAKVQDIGGHHLGAMSVSPDGKYVAFQLQSPNIKARNYDLKWIVVELERNGIRWHVDDGGDLILNPDKEWLINGNRPPIEAQWSPNSMWLYYLKRIDGSTQLWRSKRDGSAREKLTQNAADLLSFKVSELGGNVFFTTAIPKTNVSMQLQSEGDAGFLYDDRFYPSRERTPFSRTCGFNEEGRPQKVGLRRLCTPPLWIYDINKKTERAAMPEEIEIYRQHSLVTSEWNKHNAVKHKVLINENGDGRLIWLENEDPEQFSGHRPPMRMFTSIMGEEFRCNVEECYAYSGGIEGAWWRPDSNEVIFKRGDGPSYSMTGVYAWQPGSQEIRTIIRTDDQFTDCEIFEFRAICLHEQWTHPRMISAIDLNTGEVEILYDPNPEFNKFSFSKIEKIEWEDQFGNPTHGHLVYPLNFREGQRYPLVFTTYRSRGFLRGGIGDEYPIHVLAANGFMVLSHDMPRPFRRDATVLGSGRAQFEDNYERRSSLSAQEEVIGILARRGLIDPHQIAITGLSDGAEQVTFALIHSNLFSSAIVSSAFDWRVAYYSHSQQGRAFRRRTLGGAPYEDNEGLYKAMSIAQNTEHINSPLLINVSDDELPLSVESFVRLQDAGKPVEMHVFPGEYHIKWQPQHRLAIYRRNVQWLKFWLLNEEDPDPVDHNQYYRWRELRQINSSGLEP